MQRPAKITAIVGSYRKGGVIDRAVEELLTAAREAGAETKKIYLIDEPIEFCTNCRVCTQQAGVERGECVTDDRMGAILDTITFDSERWLEDEVIKYRGEAVLIEPAALRARVARRATQILKEVKGAKRLASKSRR